MANYINFKNSIIGVGDKVKVVQKVFEQSKERRQIFIGTVIKINNSGDNQSFTVRRIGVNLIGIEKIFPLGSPNLEDILVTKSGVKGAKRSKLYYIRHKSKKEIDKIYSRSFRKK